MTICHQIGSCYFNAQVRTRIIPRGFHIHAHTLGERWRWRKPFILLSPHQDSISKAYYGYKNCLILWLPEYQLLLPFEKSIQYLSFRGSVVMYMEKKKSHGTSVIIIFCYFLHQFKTYDCISREMFLSTRS